MSAARRTTPRSSAVTHGIRVEVHARYSPEHSEPPRNLWFFLYTVQIANEVERGGAAALAALGDHATRPGGSKRCAAPGWSASSR